MGIALLWRSVSPGDRRRRWRWSREHGGTRRGHGPNACRHRRRRPGRRNRSRQWSRSATGKRSFASGRKPLRRPLPRSVHLDSDGTWNTGSRNPLHHRRFRADGLLNRFIPKPSMSPANSISVRGRFTSPMRHRPRSQKATASMEVRPSHLGEWHFGCAPTGGSLKTAPTASSSGSTTRVQAITSRKPLPTNAPRSFPAHTGEGLRLPLMASTTSCDSRA